MVDELVFTVEGDKAAPAKAVSLADAGLREREHLQEWVVQHPGMLGGDVHIVTFEFDQWQRHDGTGELDRLDVLGLGSDGRLVIAELKRDIAPHPTALQALTYAAMASRFTIESLAEQHARFMTARGQTTTSEEARQRLEAHVEYEIDAETLSKPRIVLLASGFPATLTAMVVWLDEMGLDITLRQFQAYRADVQTIVTVSQLYPIRDVEEFVVAPRARASSRAPELPKVEWTTEDLEALLDETTSPTVLAAFEEFVQKPGQWVGFAELRATADRTSAQARGDLAALTKKVKSRFARSNWPFEVQWAAGGEGQAYYRMDDQTTMLLKELLAGESDDTSTGTS